MAIAAQAFILDGQITIDRALNSPTLTVRYSNANAALVELRVNGESIATRSVNPGKNSGETTFTLPTANLAGGENKIEIRLYDKAGTLLASETSKVTADAAQGPIYLTNPKMGATLQGKVELKVGFGKELKNSYVSFFIDNQFKSISNVPPFEFTWDTTRDSNGWHEVEAWVVDDSSSTFKTRKVRVFVQNPGGGGSLTNREFSSSVTTAPKPAVKVALTPAVKAAPSTQIASVGVMTANAVRTAVVGTTSTKPATLSPSVSTGLKSMTPTGTRNATQAAKPIALQTHQLPPSTILRGVPAAAETGLISITRGQRLPNIGTFVIVYNTQFVNFDVQPRVTNGVPLTPLRYLLEKAGAKVGWAHKEKNVSATADGHDIFLHIGDGFALVNKQRVDLEKPSFIDSGRTIVPLSFMRDALNVNVDYDKATGHVLITSVKK